MPSGHLQTDPNLLDAARPWSTSLACAACPACPSRLGARRLPPPLATLAGNPRRLRAARRGWLVWLLFARGLPSRTRCSPTSRRCPPTSARSTAPRSTATRASAGSSSRSTNSRRAHPGVHLRRGQDLLQAWRHRLSGLRRCGDRLCHQVRPGQRAKGGSTITQQVAKNLLVGDEYSVRRKIKEAILAYKIESTLTKQQILELYLNQIFLGRNAYRRAVRLARVFRQGCRRSDAAARLPSSRSCPRRPPTTARARTRAARWRDATMC